MAHAQINTCEFQKLNPYSSQGTFVETHQIYTSEKNDHPVSDGVDLHFSSGTGPLSPLQGFPTDAAAIELCLNTYGLSGSVLEASCVCLIRKLDEAGTRNVTQ